MRISKKAVSESIGYFQDDFGLMNQMHLASFFILKHMGVSFTAFTFESGTKMKSDFDYAISCLGGMADPRFETSESYGYLFPFHLKKLKEKGEIKKSDYYNPSTPDNKIYGRFKDTVDNSLVDPKHFLTLKSLSSEEKEYTLKPNYLDILKGYLEGSKIKITPFIIWLYRFLDFEDGVSDFSSFKTTLIEKFKDDFKITPTEFDALFIHDSMNITLDKSGILSKDIRNILNTDTVIKKLETRKNKKLNLRAWRRSVTSRNISTDILMRLVDTHKNIILYGPPGTSKSWMVDEISKNFDFFEKIQLHPTYSYDDFIYSLKFKKDEFEFFEGDFLRVCNEARKNSSKKYLLLIDEINRANLGEVLGQAILCLDRDYNLKIRTQVNEFELMIPDNLYIVGTMNSSDKSTSIVDMAIRRRFVFVRFYPNETMINEMSDYSGIGDFNVANLMNQINNRLLQLHNDPDFLLGHSFFMPKVFNKDGKIKWTKTLVLDLVNYKVIPMLEEILSGEDQISQVIGSSYYEDRFSTEDKSWEQLIKSNL